MESLKNAYAVIILKHKEILSRKKSLIKKSHYGIDNFETILAELNHISEEYLNPVLLTDNQKQEVHEIKKEVFKQFLEYCKTFRKHHK